MARRATRKPKPSAPTKPVSDSAATSVPAADAFSFLRETRGTSTWAIRDMARSLNIDLADARRVISLLELQGYVNAAGHDEWMTTIAGEGLSASQPPRFTRERIEKGLEELRKRIAETNRHRAAPYRITKAVAFGDFLNDRVRVQ